MDEDCWSYPTLPLFPAYPFALRLLSHHNYQVVLFVYSRLCDCVHMWFALYLNQNIVLRQAGRNQQRFVSFLPSFIHVCICQQLLKGEIRWESINSPILFDLTYLKNNEKIWCKTDRPVNRSLTLTAWELNETESKFLCCAHLAVDSLLYQVFLVLIYLQHLMTSNNTTIA